MARVYGNKEVLGDSACPQCRSKGHDSTGCHAVHWRNNDTGEEWVHCSKCGYYVLINEDNRARIERARKVLVEKSPEEIRAILDEVEELPFMALKSRGISLEVAERFGVRVGLSHTDGETPASHYYPKTTDGDVTGYKVRTLDHKAFYSVGNSGKDFFGIQQARYGDVYTKTLFIFEDELSAMSGYQCFGSHSKSAIKPACVSLPNGASAAASAIANNRAFVESFEEIIVCMDNDDAGQEAVSKIRAMLPHIKVARIPKGFTKDGKEIKDANDLLMDGRSLELFNALRYNAAKESPAGAATVSDCLEDALKKPEYGLSWPWPMMTDLTFGLHYGEMISVGGGTGSGCNVSHS